MERTPVGKLIIALARRIGVSTFVSVCTDLMAGADRSKYVEELRSLSGHAWNPGDSVFDPQCWGDYWLRTWGARGLLYVWDDTATDAIVAGLADEHWRPAEMCLKVTARYEVAGAGDGAAALVAHELPRVRSQALRALALVGDTSHVDFVFAAVSDVSPEVSRQAVHTLEKMSTRMDLDPGRWLKGR